MNKKITLYATMGSSARDLFVDLVLTRDDYDTHAASEVEVLQHTISTIPGDDEERDGYCHVTVTDTEDEVNVSYTLAQKLIRVADGVAETFTG